ncbi:protein-L-isoaspartate(D-aspartate) O-methyltransferase [Stygiobacter electus]|uniref:Protein-L-isoaspartate O-methyltransferase n=1 Tax=Stygiobacter electus TaxID=3032292 RepID=A0AAE3P2B8_9BACT|nr:protein-L-isoaspartate(D-aspartate) O-methyltransferase [Stygiobacter electus]MDF1611545.1 protein-L-isoaspartate(D-aspartate) O-methyltransferase [Stygiobacter electus]
MYEFEREELVATLRKRGIKNERVLSAFLKVQRHLFVPDVMIPNAYLDVALPIGQGQTISQPYTVALMTEILDPKPNDKILEIGTGSGFQAAILYELGAKVFTIERNYELYNQVLKLFDKLNYKIATRCSDGTIGWSDFAPYDGIIVTAGSPTIPENLKKQLKIGGKLIIPVGDKSTQVMKIIKKISEDKFKIEELSHFAFVPLIGREGWKE